MMRLLHFDSSGDSFNLTEFVNEIPPYGILSHTWGPDSDEVTYKELVEDSGSGKAGYRKLKFCGDQAKKDQLQYFWIDTCCIDKSNAVELQEAITSMFRWYSEAAKCYVYLADVSTEGFDPAASMELWEPAFRGSRWFTRGWTLQELIAPISVEFFSADCKLLGDKKSLQRQIHEITGIPPPALEGLIAPEKQLNATYLAVLKHSIPLEYSDEEQEKSCEMLRQILGSLITLISPLSMKSIGILLQIPDEDVEETLENLHSIIDTPSDKAHLLRLHHPSFRDFLLDKERCDDQRFWIDEKRANSALAEQCIQLMSTSLKQNIIGLGVPGTLVSEINNGQLMTALPPEVQYACMYWVQHLQKGKNKLRDDGYVHQFLREHLLSWFEALGWMKSVSEGVHAVLVLGSIVTECECPKLFEYVQDIRRFVLLNRPAIEQAPLQIYSSALIFTPRMSLVRKQFQNLIPKWVRKLPKVDNMWSGLLLTLYGHTDWVTSAVFSPCGNHLASASEDCTVRVWDAASGALQRTLEGHTERVTFVTYSPNGRWLASCSHDNTIRIWDTTKEYLGKALENDDGPVRTLVYSPNGLWLASAIHDTIRLWDTESGTLKRILTNDHVPIVALKVSPCGHFLAAASSGDSVRIWDLHNLDMVTVRELMDHSEIVTSVAFSKDGKSLVSASWDGTVKVWDIGTGTLKSTLEGHSDCVSVVVYSADGQQLASASNDHTIRVWEASTGVLQHVLEGHTHAVFALAFYPTGHHLISASNDDSIRIWDAATGVLQSIIAGLYSYDAGFVFSPSGKQLAFCSHSITVRIWDTTIYTLQQDIEQHTEPVEAVAFSPDARQLASVSEDKTVMIWNLHGGNLLRTLRSHDDWTLGVRYSPDSREIASASNDRIVKIWDAQTGVLQRTLEVHLQDGRCLKFNEGEGGAQDSDSEKSSTSSFISHRRNKVLATSFSHDGKWLAAGAYQGAVRIWDWEKGELQMTIDGFPELVNDIAFSHDDRLLAIASNNGNVRIYNLQTGRVEHILQGHTDSVNAVAFSPDGSILASASNDDTVRTWCTNTGALKYTLKTGVSEYGWYGRSGSVTALAFSSSGRGLITDLGTIDLEPTISGSQIANRPSYSLPNPDNSWIMWNGQRVLWLPVEYRPSCQAFSNDCLGIGLNSGRVIMIEFDLSHDPINDGK